MRTLLDRAPGAAQPSTLLVLLPPAKAGCDDLVAQGFVADVRARQLPVDVLLAEVSFEQVMAKTVASALHMHALGAVQGYTQIWLAGISIGAFNALHYAAVHGDRLAGLMLVAPYAGTSDILREIEDAGGPQAWAQLPGRSTADERIWWDWLCREAARPAGKPVHVGLGSNDRFIAGQRVLAGVVPATHVDEIPGEHAWPVWRQLWQRWLDKGVLQAVADAPGGIV